MRRSKLENARLNHADDIHIVNRSFFSPEKIPKIKIFHMVAKENPEVIEGRRRLISVDILDSKEVAEDASIDNDDSALD